MTNTNETQTTSTSTEPTSFWTRKPTLWIAGGLGAAALLVGGIGVGSAMADDGDDDNRPVSTERQAEPADDSSAAPSAAAATFGARDAGAIDDVLSAARGASKGTATSLEAHRDGSWSVDFDLANRDEATVLVAADGNATVVRTEAADADDANDPAPAGTFDRQNLAAIVKAAFAEAQGVIVDLDLDDNPREAYSVTVRTASGVETDIDLSTTFAVTNVDTDQD